MYHRREFNMRGMVITFDTLFSILIFITLLYFIGSVWNSLVQELDRQEEDLLQLRTQQTLTHIFNQIRKGHRLNNAKLNDFLDQANYNYTELKNSLGLEDAEFKFLVKDMDNTILYQTNTTPSGPLIVTSTRYGLTNKPVSVELWVWK
jgi:hypothetical protein